MDCVHPSSGALFSVFLCLCDYWRYIFSKCPGGIRQTHRTAVFYSDCRPYALGICFLLASCNSPGIVYCGHILLCIYYLCSGGVTDHDKHVFPHTLCGFGACRHIWHFLYYPCPVFPFAAHVEKEMTTLFSASVK